MSLIVIISDGWLCAAAAAAAAATTTGIEGDAEPDSGAEIDDDAGGGAAASALAGIFGTPLSDGLVSTISDGWFCAAAATAAASGVERDTETDVWAEIDDNANAQADTASVSCTLSDGLVSPISDGWFCAAAAK